MIAGVVLIAFAAWLALRMSFSPPSPADSLNNIFTDLGLAAPQVQQVHRFVQPPEAIQNDFFVTDFSQSETQLQALIKTLNLTADAVVSSNGTRVAIVPKVNRQFPWTLFIRAEMTNQSDQIYRVHLEGSQR